MPSLKLKSNPLFLDLTKNNVYFKSFFIKNNIFNNTLINSYILNYYTTDIITKSSYNMSLCSKQFIKLNSNFN